MIKICYMISSASNQGPCNVVYNLISNLPKNKYTTHLVTLYQGNDTQVVNRFKKNGTIVHELNYKNRIQCFFKSKEDIEKYCKTYGIDIIHSNTFFSDFSASRIVLIKKISTIHNRPFEDYLFLYGPFWGKLIAKWHVRILKRFDRCICCSKSVYEEQHKYLNNVCVVQNGVTFNISNDILQRESLNLSSNACIFIYVGGITKRKNVAKLIQLFVENRDDNDFLLILGDGVELEKCKNLADAHVIFLGFVENPSSYYAISDIYISASLSEGLSLAQLDSLSYGLVQLVSDIPSHREVVEVDSALGYTFTEESFPQLMNKVKEYDFYQQKKTIKNIYNKNFSVAKMVSNYEKIYSSLKK